MVAIDSYGRVMRQSEEVLLLEVWTVLSRLPETFTKDLCRTTVQTLFPGGRIDEIVAACLDRDYFEKRIDRRLKTKPRPVQSFISGFLFPWRFIAL